MKIQNIKETAVRILMITLLLVMLSLLISYASGNSALSLKDVLFWVGTVPIAFISITILGGISSRGRRKYRDAATPSGQSPEQRLLPGRSTVAKRRTSAIAWVIAGLLVWLASYVI